jgi:hypothetical protein
VIGWIIGTRIWSEYACALSEARFRENVQVGRALQCAFDEALPLYSH